MSAITDILVKAISEAPVASVLRERLEFAKERVGHLEHQVTDLKDQLQNKDDGRWRQVVEDLKALLNEEIEILKRKLEQREVRIDELNSGAEQKRREDEIYRLVYERMSGGLATPYDTFNAGANESKSHS